LYDLYKTLKPSHASVEEGNLAPLTMNGHEWIILAIGFAVSFVVALAVVAWFMHWVRRHGFTPFAIYRIALGIVLVILLTRGLI
jgi:undecaprenyl-diphosphatase